jgi:hypothetical protein
MHLILSLSLSSFKTSTISIISRWLKAFFFSGRLNVSQATPASSSTFRKIVVNSAIIYLQCFIRNMLREPGLKSF